eukprot:TRINITY_DN5032_c0_g2_i3.p1 TRINITY_DN5032_c0_g2~~TRINITY_DN5032_c0_g2_i3.p1  ORF type:complete len:630 (+),score=309.49 TRINITY_DN5032_c0_g2_i3:208-2097(+)
MVHLHEVNCWIPPASSLRLIFEELLPNHAWRVIITALLIEDADTKQEHAEKAPLLFDLFQEFPDASSILKAENSPEGSKKLRGLLKPLYGKRKDVFQVAKHFLKEQWLSPKSWNFGNRFIDDCYNVFVCGRWNYSAGEFSQLHPLLRKYLKQMEERGKIESHLCDAISKTNQQVKETMDIIETDSKKRKKVDQTTEKDSLLKRVKSNKSEVVEGDKKKKEAEEKKQKEEAKKREAEEAKKSAEEARKKETKKKEDEEKKKREEEEKEKKKKEEEEKKKKQEEEKKAAEEAKKKAAEEKKQKEEEKKAAAEKKKKEAEEKKLEAERLKKEEQERKKEAEEKKKKEEEAKKVAEEAKKKAAEEKKQKEEEKKAAAEKKKEEMNKKSVPSTPKANSTPSRIPADSTPLSTPASKSDKNTVPPSASKAKTPASKSDNNVATPSDSKTKTPSSKSTPASVSKIIDDESEGEETQSETTEYEVQGILGWTVRDGQFLLNVSWVGYPGENSEEPLNCFDDEIAANYLRKQKREMLRAGGNESNLKLVQKELDMLKKKLTDKGDAWDSEDEIEDDLQMSDSPIKSSQKTTLESDEEEESVLVPSSQVATKVVQTPTKETPKKNTKKTPSRTPKSKGK